MLLIPKIAVRRLVRLENGVRWQLIHLKRLCDDLVHEAEVVITDASVLAHGKAISYEVKLEAGEALSGQMQRL